MTRDELNEKALTLHPAAPALPCWFLDGDGATSECELFVIRMYDSHLCIVQGFDWATGDVPYRLAHDITGLFIEKGESVEELEVLAERLSAVDWCFADPNDPKKLAAIPIIQAWREELGKVGVVSGEAGWGR